MIVERLPNKRSTRSSRTNNVSNERNITSVRTDSQWYNFVLAVPSRSIRSN